MNQFPSNPYFATGQGPSYFSSWPEWPNPKKNWWEVNAPDIEQVLEHNSSFEDIQHILSLLETLDREGGNLLPTMNNKDARVRMVGNFFPDKPMCWRCGAMITTKYVVRRPIGISYLCGGCNVKYKRDTWCDY